MWLHFGVQEIDAFVSALPDPEHVRGQALCSQPCSHIALRPSQSTMSGFGAQPKRIWAAFHPQSIMGISWGAACKDGASEQWPAGASVQGQQHEPKLQMKKLRLRKTQGLAQGPLAGEAFLPP